VKGAGNWNLGVGKRGGVKSEERNPRGHRAGDSTNNFDGLAGCGLAGCGLAGWLMGKLRGRQRVRPRLELVERIALAPRQSLALVEAEGRRILVATSPEGGPALYPLDERAQRSPGAIVQRSSRISW
jgi:flagellar biogenesis protein FliO